MRYVIIRDDDTNALTPIECLETLYRPFLERGLPVNLATIPNVSTTATRPDGKPEQFLLAKNALLEVLGGIDAAKYLTTLPHPGPLPLGEGAFVADSLNNPSGVHAEDSEKQREARRHSMSGAGTARPQIQATSRRLSGSADFTTFLQEANEDPMPSHLPICTNPKLVSFLRNSGFKIVQHGFTHEFIDQQMEFNRDDRDDISRRLDKGTELLLDAGFPRPTTFVAPYDQLSRVSLEEVAKRFRVLSTGWYELRKLPLSWLPNYAVKKIFKKPHWRIGRTALLTHPGCHLSFMRSYDTMLDVIKRSIESRQLTVLVTHWWEYFRENQRDEKFISILHETADYLAGRNDIKVISFDDLTTQKAPLN